MPQEKKTESASDALAPLKSVVQKAPIQLKLLLGSLSAAAAFLGVFRLFGPLPALASTFPIWGSTFPFWSILALYGVSVTFIIYFLYDCFFRRQSTTRDDADCMDKCVYVVRSERRVFAELFELSTSVVKTAQRDLCITGSRSRDSAYLRAIEGQIVSNPNLSYVRVLIGPSRNKELEDHIKRLTELADNFDRTHGSGRIKVTEIPIDEKNAERFIVASETRALISLPSFNSANAHDAALIIEDDRAAQQLCAIIRSMADSAPKKIIWRKGERIHANA